MTIGKQILALSLQNELGCSKLESIELVESVLEIMKSTLARGEDVLISGFGKFTVNEKHERRGRNPQTGEKVMLSARTVVGFKPSRMLKAAVNGSDRDE